MTITAKNFYKYTCAVWIEVDQMELFRDVDKKPHVFYESESGSKYYTLKDKVYRVSNHFNYEVNTCSWLVLRKDEKEPIVYNEATPLTTVCFYEDFVPKRTLWVKDKTRPENYPALLKAYGVYPDQCGVELPRPPVVTVHELFDAEFGITYHLLPPKYLTLFNREAVATKKQQDTFESLKKDKVSFSYYNTTKTGKRVLGQTYYNMRFIVETFHSMKFQYPRKGEAKPGWVYIEKSRLKDVEIFDND
jgi:hypothetical protein